VENFTLGKDVEIDGLRVVVERLTVDTDEESELADWEITPVINEKGQEEIEDAWKRWELEWPKKLSGRDVGNWIFKAVKKTNVGKIGIGLARLEEEGEKHGPKNDLQFTFRVTLASRVCDATKSFNSNFTFPFIVPPPKGPHPSKLGTLAPDQVHVSEAMSYSSSKRNSHGSSSARSSGMIRPAVNRKASLPVHLSRAHDVRSQQIQSKHTSWSSVRTSVSASASASARNSVISTNSIVAGSKRHTIQGLSTLYRERRHTIINESSEPIIRQDSAVPTPKIQIAESPIKEGFFDPSRDKREEYANGANDSKMDGELQDLVVEMVLIPLGKQKHKPYSNLSSQNTHSATKNLLPAVRLYDIFLLEVFFINLSPRARTLILSICPTTGASLSPAADSNTILPRTSTDLSTILLQSFPIKHRVAEIVSLENKVIIEGLEGGSCRSVRLRFLSLREGIWRIGNLEIEEVGGGEETERKKSIVRSDIAVVVDVN
jgi:hypothetical protein